MGKKKIDANKVLIAAHIVCVIINTRLIFFGDLTWRLIGAVLIFINFYYILERLEKERGIENENI